MTKKLEFLKGLIKSAKDNEITALATKLTYHLIFALFPFLIFLISLVGFFNIQADYLMTEVSSILPGEIADMVNNVINEVVDTRNPSILTTSLVLALYTVANGFRSIMRGINRVYVQKDERHFLKRWGLCLVLVLVLAAAIIFSLLGVIFGGAIQNLFPTNAFVDGVFSVFGVLVTFAILLFAVVLIYCLSSAKKHRFLHLLPGAVLTILVWGISAWGFNIYISNNVEYHNTMQTLNLIATAAFGLEAVVKRELTALNVKNISVRDGWIYFTGGYEAIAAANMWLRSADRVLLMMGKFEALTFDELFEKTKALAWADWIPKNGKFTVLAKSVRSKLASLSDIQAIVKKAVVEKLKQTYKIERFPEDGPEYTIRVSVLKDEVTITIDTTGAKNGLHKRGYREKSAIAPLKETMAAALILLSYYKPGRTLLDFTCGSGTIPIEAALIAKNIAPGLFRTFACESWPRIPASVWKEARKNAYAAIDNSNSEQLIFGSDIDPVAIELAKANAELAGVDDCVYFECKPLNQVILPGKHGIAISNPPYGERLGRMNEINQLYADMGKLLGDSTWSVYVLTSDEFFESAFGRKASAKRKLFNGNIKTDYYQYYGQKP